MESPLRRRAEPNFNGDSYFARPEHMQEHHRRRRLGILSVILHVILDVVREAVCGPASDLTNGQSASELAKCAVVWETA